MTKLKCWKKTGESNQSVSYRHTKEDKIVASMCIANNPRGKPYSFNNDGHIDRNFRTKSQSVKFLNKYMKSHDKC